MRSDHLIAFGIGLVVGWLVLPMVLAMFTGKKAG